jgi:hypothetical protein
VRRKGRERAKEITKSIIVLKLEKRQKNEHFEIKKLELSFELFEVWFLFH